MFDLPHENDESETVQVGSRDHAAGKSGAGTRIVPGRKDATRGCVCCDRGAGRPCGLVEFLGHGHRASDTQQQCSPMGPRTNMRSGLK